MRDNDALWSLFETIVRLRDDRECASFFRDLCTFAELEAMAERWEVAQLVAKHVPYRRISELTGASTATVTRIAHWYQHGEGGYQMAIERSAGRAHQPTRPENSTRKQ